MKAKNKAAKTTRPPKQKKAADKSRTANRTGPGMVFLTSVAVGVVGIAGYFGWQYLRKRKASPQDDISLPGIIEPPVKPVKPVKETPKKQTDAGTVRNDNFPLKKGSKGERVRLLQQALVDKYGSSTLPKYGTDGDFGPETAAALKKQGIAEPVTESAYNLLVQAGGVSDVPGMAQKLLAAASGKKFSEVIGLLKNLRNKQDYQQVSDKFMQSRLRGVRQTLVNGLLSSFTDAAQKQQIGMEFVRIGLQFNGSKWSLSGFDGRPVVTTEPATVWITATQSVQVPALMLLGNEVSRRLDYTLFENNNKYFLIKTQSIKYF